MATPLADFAVPAASAVVWGSHLLFSVHRSVSLQSGEVFLPGLVGVRVLRVRPDLYGSSEFALIYSSSSQEVM